MPQPIPFDNSYARLADRFYARQAPDPVQAPHLIRFNGPLADYLGIDRAVLEGDAGAALVTGNALPQGAEPLAMAYAGHQFGHLNPQLGDGRALLLGEVVARDGVRHDLHLKGSGPTPFSRGGDGRSPLGPVLREYVVSEAMAALGVPTTRSLAAATTGEPVFRETTLPGAVLLRVARSHIRVGTFEYFSIRRDTEGLRQLVDYVIDRHYPECAAAPIPAIALLDAVAERQATLVAQWQLLGFIHGVMNTDNMLVCGDTIDYGPCAFMDEFDLGKVFSSIDQHGRYAYRNQGPIAQWNVAVLARALLGVFGDDKSAMESAGEQAQGIVDGFAERFTRAFDTGLALKLGLSRAQPLDTALGDELLSHMQKQQADFTLTFRRLAELADESLPADQSVAALCTTEFDPQWLERWQARLSLDPRPAAERAADMRKRCPALIPRNHLIEAAIRSAEDEADLAPFHALVAAGADPCTYDADRAGFARAPEPAERVTKTFCGT